MMETLEKIFGKAKCLIGVVHLLPLPGSPRWRGSMRAVIERAVNDAVALESAGFHGIILENYGDAPYSKDFAGRGAIAAMGAAGRCVADRIGVPVGVNVLRNDARSAVAVAAAIGGRFTRVNVHTGAQVTDQGLVEGTAMDTLRAIRDMAPDLVVFADVLVKHSVPLGDVPIASAARDAVERGLAGAVIVTGDATGSPASKVDLEKVKGAVPDTPVLVGSGVTPDSVAEMMGTADGVIVGSAVMNDGRAGNQIDAERAAGFAGALAGDWFKI